MRIAVCLSGEPRTWRAAQKSILSYYDVHSRSEAITVDYFIHTWLGNSWKIDGVFEFEDVDVSEMEEIRSIFSPVAMAFDPPRREDLTVWGSLFTSQQRSFHLKRQHEVANGFEYDIVVKARLDVIYPPGEVFQTHSMPFMTAYAPEPLFRMPREYGAVNFNEVVYYGDSVTMDLIGEVVVPYEEECHWGRYHARAHDRRELPVMKYGPGAYMWKYMNRHNILGSYAPSGIRWTIVRKEAAGLDCVIQYDEIVAHHQAHYK